MGPNEAIRKLEHPNSSYNKYGFTPDLVSKLMRTQIATFWWKHSLVEMESRLGIAA
jgi:hypothetical protein